MKSSLTMLKRAVPLACASLLLVAGAAQAALEDRDLDGDTVVDAFYDTDLDITWLRDANASGAMDWDAAVAWAGAYSFGGYSDWRLPAWDGCFGYNCTASEMGHLYYVELGNVALGGLTNTGNFQNLLSTVYWSSSEYPGSPDYALGFSMVYGDQGGALKSDSMWSAMAVRDGDIAAIPEPGTYALILAGLAGLAVGRRRTR